MTVLRGTIAAALTPLTPGGGSIDEAVIPAYVDFLVAGGLDGVLTFGTNGEAVLFDVGERKQGLEAFRAAAGDRLLVAAHCGAQTTQDGAVQGEIARRGDADARPDERIQPRQPVKRNGGKDVMLHVVRHLPAEEPDGGVGVC